MNPKSDEASAVLWRPRWWLWWKYLKLNGPVKLNYTEGEVNPDMICHIVVDNLNMSGI